MPAQWTKEKPKIEGWYWLRESYMGESIVFVGENGNDFDVYVEDHCQPLSKFSGEYEWSDEPIEEPEEKQIGVQHASK